MEKDLFGFIKEHPDMVECKVGHIFYSGYPSCPVCKMNKELDGEDLEENNG